MTNEDVFINDFEMYMHLWMEQRGITDMCKVSQNRWYNCLKFIYKNTFKLDPYKLKTDDNHNRYDLDKVLNILEIYIDMSNDYEKIINQVGFCTLTGIHRDTLNAWERGENITSDNSDVTKKIKEMFEESLLGLQVSGKGNPMQYMPALNKHCGYNMPGTRDQVVTKRALTAAELPTLGARIGELPQIQDKQIEELTDKRESCI